jgi:hypothetical protein
MDTRPGRRPDPPDQYTRLGAGQRSAGAAPPVDASTRLGRRPSTTDERASTELGARPPETDARAERTQLGERGTGGARPAGGELRFGPGVRSAPGWSVAGSVASPDRRRPGRRSVIPALTTLVIAAALAYLLLWRPDPLVVLGAEVAPAVDLGRSCDVTVDVVGTIRTNGRAGTIEYRWLRSDGESTAPLSQTVAADTPAIQVHLLWTLSGRGSYPATARLQILHPQPVEATGGFTYSCR